MKSQYVLLQVRHLIKNIFNHFQIAMEQMAHQGRHAEKQRSFQFAQRIKLQTLDLVKALKHAEFFQNAMAATVHQKKTAGHNLNWLKNPTIKIVIKNTIEKFIFKMTTKQLRELQEVRKMKQRESPQSTRKLTEMEKEIMALFNQEIMILRSLLNVLLEPRKMKRRELRQFIRLQIEMVEEITALPNQKMVMRLLKEPQ